MAKQMLTDKTVTGLKAPAKGLRIVRDAKLPGFGVRVLPSGTRAFVLDYMRAGRRRIHTIGRFPEWSTAAARKHAADLKRRIRYDYYDPAGELSAEREAPSVADLIERFEDEHLPRLRPSSAKDYRSIIALEIRPSLGRLKVAEVRFSDVDALHRKITRRGAPGRANRVHQVIRKMFNSAIKWGWIERNPCIGVERNPEQPRHRYLSVDELARLTAALAAHSDQQAANIIRLLLLTGARRGEAQGMRWADLDLKKGVWTKPGSTTKQKTLHRVPLSSPARQLLVELRQKADADAEFVFPSRSRMGYRVELKTNWARLCRAADIKGARIHDLRHSFASVLVSSGLSLEIIGALLGHTQASTTKRYAHLADDPLRQAAERAGAIIMGKQSAEIVPLKERGDAG